MTNTERLIYSLGCAINSGMPHLNFMVGKYTGNGSSVVAALRRRGYMVTRVPGSRATYRLQHAEKNEGKAAGSAA